MPGRKYQYGTLTIRKRKKGPDVWQYRWAENGVSRSVLIGTVEKYPTMLDAERVVENRRSRINAEHPYGEYEGLTVGALIDRFMQEYAPRRCRPNTQKNYLSIFKNHVRPRWGGELVCKVKRTAVEDWLESYSGSTQVKSHVKHLMHTLFFAALRWEIVAENPLDHMKLSAKRLKSPRVLTPAELRSLLTQLSEPYRTMVITASCLGLRVSELLGLQWSDIDFEKLTVKIQRSVVEGKVNPTKTDASESLLPLDPDLARVLQEHRSRSTFKAAADFVFASDEGKPRWKDGILADYLKPAAAKAEIGNIGWHTFRHTYSTWLHALGTTPAVQKELLRHANIQTTLNLYTRAVSEEKRAAASKIAGILHHPVLADAEVKPASC